jgi:endonuclease G
MELERAAAERSVDALRFLKRGQSVVDAVVLINLDGGRMVMFNGVRVTPELVIALRGEMNVAGAAITVDGTAAEMAWASTGEALLLRTRRYEGALPDLSLPAYHGSLTLISTNRAGETRIAFGRAQPNAQHDVPTELESMGAPLFDDTWGVVGLHKSYDARGTRAYVPIAQLARELEQSPWWDEIAAVHRLVRTVATTAPAPVQEATVEPDLARAVRWSTGDDAEPMSVRDRRRAIAGKSLDDLKRARGAAAATTPEQRAIDRVLEGPGYALNTIGDDILLPFATAARWFRGIIPGLPDDQALEREISCRRQHTALVAIVGPHFAPREPESRRLFEWLADSDRRPLVMRGPGGIGKSALLAHFILENEKAIRFAWIDFDRPDVSADEPSIMRVVDEHLSWQAPRGPLVVVLDSFETAVQTYGYRNLNPALDALARRFDDLAVVVGSRTAVPLLKVQGEPAQDWDLPGLPLGIVTQWLVDEGVSADLADDIALLTNGVPLNMKLARDLVKGKSADEARDIVASMPKQLVTGYLYRRILRRLRDDRLKDLAQWTMVPRRLVPELLAAILDVTAAESHRLFSALRSELTLLEGSTTLTVRPDLRNTLLPLLEAEDAERVREIDAIAADFWSQRADDEIAAAEAVYHALRLADTARAHEWWRPGLARHLGGYAMEEVPPQSQAWLERQLSLESADQAAAGHLVGGAVSEAAATLRAEPRGVHTLKGRKRRRAVSTLAAESHVDVASTTQGAELEAIVIVSSRPAIAVRGATCQIDSAPWSHLEQQRPLLEAAIAATGRVQLADGTVLGTAVRVGPGLFMTTRSVVNGFAVGGGHSVRMIEGRTPAIDMRAEGPSSSGDVHAITRVVLMHPYWDVALVEAETPDPGISLKLATRAPTEGTSIVVVGHPANNEQENDLLSKVFDNVFDVKRLMPGKYVGQQAEFSLGRTVEAGVDDAIALSADFGAAVVNAITGELIGVRFSWVFLASAKFVPAWELARDPEIAKAGVLLGDTPLPAPPWTSTWNVVTPARHTLLEAFVARTSGDVERARALLATVDDADRVIRIDRALLLAACELTADRLRAADLLHEVLEQNPREAWPGEDRDAVIATRLRLIVDAEAEREFLRLLHEQSVLAGLLEPRHFRVLVPPGGNLPWDRTAQSSTDRQYPLSAVAIAKRIVDASNRCLALRGWIEKNGGELANPGYLFSRSPAHQRELAAAYVAYPFDMVRSTADFLLDKTDLTPHPAAGWTPVVEPLLLMFRDARGGPPEGITSAKDLEGWLDAKARSRRLGYHLIEQLRFDSPVAWQAGLLHLTTELPIEGLLKRRFSGEKSA